MDTKYTPQEIKQLLLQETDDRYREFSKSLLPGITNIIGVRLPVLRKLAKQIIKADWKNYLEYQPEFMEEIMLQGMIIGLISTEKTDEILNYIRNFIPKINNWSVCDSFCCSLKLASKQQDIFWEFLQSYISSNKEYHVRFALVMYLNYFVNEKYIDEILRIITSIKSDKYYIQTATAWLASVCYIKFPDKTHKIIENLELDKTIHNKSIQKIIESSRINPSTKNMLKKMKYKNI